MGSWYRKHWPWLAASAAFLLAATWLYLAIVSANGGHFVYGLDDPYIHLQVARNLLEHGSWGINPGQFESASSSLLWAPVLALFRLATGGYQFGPLILNVVAGLGLLAVASQWMLRRGVGQWWRLAAMLAMVFGTPWLAMVFNGMEHMVQALLVLTFVWLALDRWFDALTPRRAVALAALATLVTMSRFECLVVVGVVCLVYLLRLRVLASLALGAAALLPVVAFGWFSLAHGSYFLPNSVLLKSMPTSNPTHFFLGGSLLNGLYSSRLLAALLAFVLAVLLLWILRRNRWFVLGRPEERAVAAFVLATLVHLETIYSQGVLYRYIFYLMPLGIAAAATLASQQPWRQRGSASPLSSAAGYLSLAALGYLGWVAAYTARVIPLQLQVASHEVYSQQYQMALFLHRYYPTAIVAANDIGAISFFNGIGLVDLAGLATVEATRAHFAGQRNQAFYSKISADRHVQIAVVYPAWFRYATPPSWQLVGGWMIIGDTHVVGSPTVAWYAVDPSFAPGLRRSLEEFNRQLPPNIFARIEDAPR